MSTSGKSHRLVAPLISVFLVVTASPLFAAKTRPVVFGPLQTYTQRNAFAIDVPANWTRTDRSKPGEAIVLWGDPTGNAELVVDVFDAPPKTSTELSQLLQTFLRKALGANPRFVMFPTRLNTGAAVAWSYQASSKTATGVIKAKMEGHSYIRQTRGRISIVSIAIPAEQFPSSQPRLASIVDSIDVLSGTL